MKSEVAVNVAIIGCGRIAGHHCRSMVKAPRTAIRAVCDLVPEKAEAYSKEFNIPFYTDYREMLERHPEVNLVTIATPSGMHFEHGMEILRDFHRNIVVEKPTFMRIAQVDEAYDTAAKLGLKIFPVFQNRHNRAVQRVLQGVRSGELGAIRIAAVRMRWCRPERYYKMSAWRGTYSHDGGALTNQGVHYIDLLRYVGGEIARLSCSMRTIGAPIEVEDSVVAQLQYDQNQLGVVEVTTAARPDDFEASLSFVCEKGLAQIGGIAANELQVYSPSPDQCALHSEQFPTVYGFGHGPVYCEVAEDLCGVRPFSVTFEDCRRSIQLLHSFYHSSEIGSWVEVASCADSSLLGRPDERISDLYRTPRRTARGIAQGA